MAKQKAKPLEESSEKAPVSPKPIDQSAKIPSKSVASSETGYTKQQFLGSAKYAAYKDVLTALLEDDGTYTADQVDQLLIEFSEKEAE